MNVSQTPFWELFLGICLLMLVVAEITHQVVLYSIRRKKAARKKSRKKGKAKRRRK